MMLCEASVTIPGWLTLAIGAGIVLVSLQMFSWYLETTDPYPYFTGPLPYLAEKDEDEE